MTTKLLKRTNKLKKPIDQEKIASLGSVDENITLEQLLTAYFGKNKVKVVHWKWTDEQLKQLKNQEKRPKK